MSQLHTPRELNFNAGNLAEEWRHWEMSFNSFAPAKIAKKNVCKVAVQKTVIIIIIVPQVCL